MSNNQRILLLLLIIIIVSTLFHYNSLKESWFNYRLNPYGDVRTGSMPANFYIHNRYVKPYMWPDKIYSTYPYDHWQPLS